MADPHSSLSTPVPASMDQRSELTGEENVEHDMSQLAASRAQCSKNLAASWTLDENSFVGQLALTRSVVQYALLSVLAKYTS